MNANVKILLFILLATVMLGSSEKITAQQPQLDQESFYQVQGAVKGGDSVNVQTAELTATPQLMQDYGQIAIPLNIILDPPTAEEKATLVNDDRKGALKIGFGRTMPSLYQGNILPLLQWQPTSSGGQTAVFKIVSPGAKAIRAALKATDFTKALEIRFFSLQDKDQIFGPYTAKDLQPLIRAAESSEDGGDNSIFWSPIIEGESVGIELYLPSFTQAPGFSLEAPQISHLVYSMLHPNDESAADSGMVLPSRASDIGRAGACNKDVACDLQTNPPNLPDATVKITSTVGGTTYLCTGTLLQDSDSDSKIPFFMTSGWCITSQSEARTMESYWFFQKTSCSGTQYTMEHQSGGADWLARDTNLDFTLLQLNTDVPNGAYFAGWTSAPITPGSYVLGIHHPMGDLKKWSQGTAAGFSPRGGAVNNAGGYIRVTWSDGVTEYGSLGSGLFDTEGNFRGILSTGLSSCSASNEPDWYGRFDQIYPSVSQWLSTGATVLKKGVALASSLSQGRWQEFKINVPSDNTLKVELYNLSQDADLFVRRGMRATTVQNNCKSLNFNTSPEACSRPNYGNNTWYIGVIGYAPGITYFTIKASLERNPAVTFNPGGLAFGNQQVGVTSAPQVVTLTNSGAAPLTISGISTSDGFTQTNTCGPSLGPGASCSINVDSLPSRAGSYIGQLTVTSDADGSPHMVGLNGIGVSVFTLAVSKTGSGQGVVTSNPPGIGCGGDCRESYVNGVVVALTAIASSGSRFTGWNGACSGASKTCWVTMNQARTVTATFVKVYRLTVSKTGRGTVTSSPSGINCGSDCTESYTSGKVVTLKAKASSGYRFTGWSGACRGKASCRVTMNGTKAVKVTFSRVKSAVFKATSEPDHANWDDDSILPDEYTTPLLP